MQYMPSQARVHEGFRLMQDLFQENGVRRKNSGSCKIIMVTTDPIADMISRMKNAIKRKKDQVDVPSSKMKQEIARLLKEEGYIANYKNIEDNKQGVLQIFLKYTEKNQSVIREMKRISKPGKRVYADSDNIPKVIEGLGRAVISTSRGVMTDNECRKNKLGGEVLLYVW